MSVGTRSTGWWLIAHRTRSRLVMGSGMEDLLGFGNLVIWRFGV
jgi:hypothetical protein